MQRPGGLPGRGWLAVLLLAAACTTPTSIVFERPLAADPSELVSDTGVRAPLADPSDTGLPMCNPGDASFCHFLGRCDAAGMACVCDDLLHYDPADRCATWQPAVVPVGMVCLPGDRSTCSDRGACDPSGQACACDEPVHFSPEDFCAAWRPGAP